ncbi:carnitine O-acetyltransferase [Pseudohyphozyma bogoriensis]|nr:carnitine O-acetyltransferase [Pseudohyphozyma bogoriensis]
MFATSQYRPDQPKTFSFQPSLPRLPVPALAPTFERYIKSLRPLLLQDALTQGKGQEYVEEEIKKREELAKDFLKKDGLGPVLQERLKDVDRAAPNNWLDDTIWMKNAYHSWRAALPLQSNWWILMADDKGIPEEIRNSVPPTNDFTEWQIKRTAKMVSRLVDFKLKLDREEILPDSSRAGPFCMHQYTKIFGVTRVPKKSIDDLVHSPHPHPSEFAIVIANDHFYKLPVLSSGTPIPLQTLEAQIWAIGVDAQSRPTGAGVGACTGAERDEWAKTREHLLVLDPQNRKTITEIEDSLFVVSLDDRTCVSKTYKSSSPATQTPDLDAHIYNASASAGTGRNRWWDKAVSIQVETNGRGTMVGEHSPCDALIPSIVCDYVLAEGVGEEGVSQKGVVKDVERLEWVLDEKARENIESAVRTVAALAKDSEGKMLWYDEYGIDWIKKVAKQAPDAYLQMALQLAYHKMHGVPVATYETASTRIHLHGRTDVIRTLSEDSWRWVEEMRKETRDYKVLYALLSNATKSHNNYTRDASAGRGCDRHLMALQLLMQDGESHPVFKDRLFARSQEWVLSTSGLSEGNRFYGTGFGTIWHNGYGVNYMAGKQIIKFGIESRVSDPHTSTDRFRDKIVEAMREMREVCEKGQVVAPPAKL